MIRHAIAMFVLIASCVTTDPAGPVRNGDISSQCYLKPEAVRRNSFLILQCEFENHSATASNLQVRSVEFDNVAVEVLSASKLDVLASEAKAQGRDSAFTMVGGILVSGILASRDYNLLERGLAIGLVAGGLISLDSSVEPSANRSEQQLQMFSRHHILGDAESIDPGQIKRRYAILKVNGGQVPSRLGLAFLEPTGETISVPIQVSGTSYRVRPN